MASGKLKFFCTKGYGFIYPDDGSEDVFLHITEVERAGIERLVEDGPINYEMGIDRKTHRPCAINISIPELTN